LLVSATVKISQKISGLLHKVDWIWSKDEQAQWIATLKMAIKAPSNVKYPRNASAIFTTFLVFLCRAGSRQ